MIFSWNLGTSVPKGVVQLLSKTQPQLQSLSISNDTSCSQDYSLSLDDFNGFSSLRRARFVPGELPNEQAIGKMLQQSAHDLEELDFDQQNPFSDGHEWENMNQQNAFTNYLICCLALGTRSSAL